VLASFHKLHIEKKSGMQQKEIMYVSMLDALLFTLKQKKKKKKKTEVRQTDR
jgi:hypothetical protein